MAQFTDNYLDRKFNYHKPDEKKAVKHQDVRLACSLLAQKINAECPASQETSLAIESIEMAMFWSNAAISRHVDV